MVEKAETSSSEPDFVTNPELEDGIVKNSITTFTILKESLPIYLQAAINLQKHENLNFEVTVIAQPDEYYLTNKTILSRHRNANGQVIKTQTITAVKSQDPVKKGYVAISLKKPDGVKFDTAFNLARQQEEQRREH